MRPGDDRPDTGPDADPTDADVVGGTDRHFEPIGKLDGGDSVHDAEYEHNEFVAAHPGDEVVVADAIDQAPGYETENFVADVVTVSVIDRLEVVEIDVEQGQRAPRFDERLQPFGQQIPIAQAGEAVVSGEVLEPPPGGVEVADVLAGHDEAGDDRVVEEIDDLEPDRYGVLRLGVLHGDLDSRRPGRRRAGNGVAQLASVTWRGVRAEPRADDDRRVDAEQAGKRPVGRGHRAVSIEAEHDGRRVLEDLLEADDVICRHLPHSALRQVAGGEQHPADPWDVEAVLPDHLEPVPRAAWHGDPQLDGGADPLRPDRLE